jgi:hypothetical protein
LWLLENYDFPLDTLHNRDVQTGDLSRYDAIIITDQAVDEIFNGRRAGTMPDEYTGGLGSEGMAALARFTRNGGTLIAFDDASDLLIDQLGLPVRNAVADVPPEDFFIPGSLVRTDINVDHPMAYGMQAQTAASYQRSRAFEILRQSKAMEGGRVDTPAAPEPPVEVVARYAEEDVLMSGWAMGEEEYLAGRPAMVTVRHGQGQVVLFAFRPQFRGQPRGTYKLIFNALYSSTLRTRLVP